MNHVNLLRAVTLIIIICCVSLPGQSQENDYLTNPPGLRHHMTEEEAKNKHLIGYDFVLTQPPTGPVRNVAEFERMQAVLIRASLEISYAVIKEMAEDIHVITIVAGTSQQNTVINNYIANGVNINNCSFLIAETNTIWTRDYGPWFIFDSIGQPAIVDFPYNRPRPKDNAIPAAMATHLNIDLYAMNVVHAGGNYMTDGMGISASSELVWEENLSLTPTQINQIFNDYLGIQTYHVVPDPNNTYIDHIDCWGKFLAPDKILIREVPQSHPQYTAIEATSTYFANQLSAYGTPLKVFRVYTPGDQPYTNSLILNDKVLVPIMNSPHDNAALEVYQQAMPGYNIVGVTGSWQSTDALHCRTMGIADIGMLHIGHVPVTGIQPDTNQYLIEANIKAHSGALLKTDSLLIIYSINGAPWDTISMSVVSGNLYAGTIPVPVSGSMVAYYLYAVDHSGRREYHPFIGQPDPYIFYSGTPSYPEMIVSTTTLSVTLPVDGTTTLPIIIQNAGLIPLNFSAAVSYTNKSGSIVQVHPLAENYRTGSTTSTALTQTSLVKGAPPSEAGWMTFDISGIPVGATINSIVFNGYVNATYYPYWNINPVNNDPMTASPPVLYNDIIQESSSGYYLFRSESSNYSTGWKSHTLGGNANADLEVALNQGWFTIGIMDRDNVSDFYIHFDGWAETNPPYLIVDYTYNPSYNWLTVDNDVATNGTVLYQDIYEMDVGIDASGLETGIYTAQIIINSNDPDAPVTFVPVILEIVEMMEVELKVWLEGPFEETEMSNVLNQKELIPLSHPYANLPWNHIGTETVASIPNSEIVDWILVEFRDAESAASAGALTTIRKQAAFLLKNGTVVDLDGVSNITLSTPFSNNLYIALWHRNHLGILSAFPAIVDQGNISYDFTTDIQNVFGSAAGFKELLPGIAAMVAGDGNADGLINATDKSTIWEISSGQQDYLSGDFNLDGQINNNDKNDLWRINLLFECQIPD